MFQKKKKNELKIIQWIHNLNFNEVRKRSENCIWYKKRHVDIKTVAFISLLECKLRIFRKTFSLKSQKLSCSYVLALTQSSPTIILDYIRQSSPLLKVQKPTLHCLLSTKMVQRDTISIHLELM